MAADWLDHFKQRLREILIVLALNVLAYFVFIAHFMLQNHSIRFPWVPLTDQIFAGRWFTSVLFWLNGGANIPVITPLLTIAFSLIAVVLVVRLWGSRLRGLRYVLVLSLFTLYPAFTGVLYYHYHSTIFTASILLAVMALLTASRLSLPRIATASLLVCFSMATYQPVLSTLATVFVAYCLATMMVYLQEGGQAGAVFRERILPRLLALGIGGMLYNVLRFAFVRWVADQEGVIDAIETSFQPT